MSLSFILLFSLTVFVASILPGPSMLLALTHGMYHGAKRTIASAMGNVTVTLIQAAISIAGLGTILLASETIFQFVKLAGAAYLIYMGISILCSSRFSIPTNGFEHSPKQTPLRKLYFQGALITAGNPKAIVFFTAVFPQFIEHDAVYLPQFCILVSICALIAFFCFMIYAVGGQKIVSLFPKSAFSKCVKRIIGSAFVGAGIGLATSNR